jgi:hypothetical protein
MNKIRSSCRASERCVLNGDACCLPVYITSTHDLSKAVELMALSSKSTAEMHRARDFRLTVL